MQIKPLEVFADDSNYAVIKPPGRNFPGCVIQGDSLRILCGLATSIASRIRDHQPEDEEFLEDVEDLVSKLVGRMLHYQEVLRRHDIQLPYTVPVTEADLVKLLPENET